MQFFVKEREPWRMGVTEPLQRRCLPHTISQQPDALQDILDDDWFENIQLPQTIKSRAPLLEPKHTSNCPLAPATLTVVWLPMTCAATIVIASH
jgi:hypothetical protein